MDASVDKAVVTGTRTSKDVEGLELTSVARTDAELAKAKVTAKATVEERIMKSRWFFGRKC